MQTRHIAWNGAQLHIPVSWEVRVAGTHHLIIEQDFQPLMEIRWEKSARKPAKQYQAVLQRFIKQTSAITYQKRPAVKWRQLNTIFQWTPYSQGESQTMDGGICRCLSCNSLVFFHLFQKVREEEVQAAACLSSFSCHNQNNEGVTWRIQDFSLVTPPPFILSDYTFGAGLTRLSFSAPYTTLHICKLGPAATRLKLQSLEDILLTLCGVEELETHEAEDNSFCEGHRTPTIGKQIVIRLRREKPFVWARIWHDNTNDRLLAVVLNSTRPLSRETAHLICNHYEIV